MNRALLARYWPFMALVALQLLLVTLSTSDPETTAGTAFAVDDGSGSASGQFSSGSGQFTGAAGPSGSTGGTVATNGAAGGGQTPTGGSGQVAGQASQAATSGGGGGGAGEGGGNVPGSVQTLDNMGRPLDGDKTKCGKDGVLQEDISLQSPPCMPRYAGDNGGATYSGVTGEKITVVVYYTTYDAGVQQVLAANELAMSQEQADELNEVYEQFFNGHYEFYGRELEVIAHLGPGSDAIALRAEAKAVVQKYKPFAVLFYAQGLMPMVMADQFARDGVLNLGLQPVADDFFLERAPYVWSQVIQGYRMADLAADYYCKKMHGKPASLAGDPAMRLQTRKLGVGASEDPNSQKTALRFIGRVTGGDGNVEGYCGSKADGVTLYTYSSDPDTAESQAPAMVSRMKSDGITTLHRGQVCAEGDKQQYFPEIFDAQVFDDDYVGRVFAALCGPTQMAQVFGIGMFPEAVPREKKEFYVAAQSVNPNYKPAYLAEGAFQGLAFLSRLIQYAGPNLNPQTVYQGSRSTPQIGGWENPNPWPGWVCCNQYTPQYNIGVTPDSFTAKNDARQIYWDGSARSKGDGAAGAWVGVDDSRRYEIGKWPAGEPKQP